MSGPPVAIGRQIETPPVSLTADVSTTPEIAIQKAAFGSILIPVGATTTTLTYYGAKGVGGTYVAIADIGGEQPVAAAGGYKIPDNCFGYGALKIVADVAVAAQLILKG